MRGRTALLRLLAASVATSHAVATHAVATHALPKNHTHRTAAAAAEKHAKIHHRLRAKARQLVEGATKLATSASAATQRKVAATISAAPPAVGSEPHQKCYLIKNFFTRLGVLFFGAGVYMAYTAHRMRTGQDKRSFAEFAAMFFNLCAHQSAGGLMLLLYSSLQKGLDPIVWYSATFDFEFLFTMLYIKFVKSACAPKCFEWHSRRSGERALFLGQVHDATGSFRFDYFVVQFLVSVCVVGVGARAASLCTVSLLQSELMPINVVRILAAFYYSLPLNCAGQVALALYIKPAAIDAATFTLSDWLLSSHKSLSLAERASPERPTRSLV